MTQKAIQVVLKQLILMIYTHSVAEFSKNRSQNDND